MESPVSAVIANLYIEIFEEQAIEYAPCNPKIWKCYVDDTFTILHRDRIDSSLQHINSQQPTIHFTMETKSDSKIAFLDATVSWRKLDSRLTTSIYRKPTHTDQYLAYDSHHPKSVKRGMVKCLYDWAKCLVTKPSVISEEKKHLSSVLVSFLLCAEDHQGKNSPQERACSRVQIHRRFTLCTGSIGASSPLPRTTRHLHHLQIWNDTYM